LGAGWKTWDVGAKDEEGEAIKEAAKKKRKEEGIEKSKKTRTKKAEETQMTWEEEQRDRILNPDKYK